MGTYSVEEARIVGGDEENEWRDENGRVQHCVVFVALYKTLHVLVVSLLHDLLVQGVARLEPLGSVRAGEVTLLG